MIKEKFKRKDVKIIITPEEYDSIINAINKCSDGAITITNKDKDKDNFHSFLKKYQRAIREQAYKEFQSNL